MNIKRMLLLASMSLAAIAFAAPAVAQANVTLKDDGGTILKPGAKVTATSTNLQTHTAGSTLTCGLVTLHLEVVTNNDEHVVVEQLGEATTKNCHVKIGENILPATIDDGTLLEELTIDTWGHGSVEATFLSTVFLDAQHTMLASACDYKGNVTVQAKESGSSMLTVPAGKSFLTAPGCDVGELTGEFTLETPVNETHVIIEFSKTG